MFKLIYFLFLAVAVLSVTAVGLSESEDVDHSPRELSNAARLARGLPPLSPKFGRFLPGQNTPVLAARIPTPSGNVVSGLNGNIKVTHADTGELVGYVIPNGGFRGITSDQSSALKITFNSGSDPRELVETAPTDSNHHFLGAVANLANSVVDLAAGSFNYAILTGTAHTAAGAPPSNVGNSLGNQVSESTIWNYNGITNSLSATWINSNGVAAPTILYYVPSVNILFLVGDPVAFDGLITGGYAVAFTLV